MEFTYDGVSKPWVRALVGLDRPAWSPIEHEIVEIAGRQGGYITDRKIKAGIINVPVEIKGTNKHNFHDRVEELAGWLIKDDITPRPLIFPDRPHRVYYAVVTGSLNLEEILHRGKGVIQFLYPDGVKFGHPQSLLLDTVEPNIISNGGTAPTKPIFKLWMRRPSTHIDIFTKDDFMSIGYPDGVGYEAYQPRERLMDDKLRSLVGWYSPNIVPDNGSRTGTMIVTADGFGATNYGSHPTWHGPSMAKDFAPCGDYFIQARMWVQANHTAQRARCDLYMLTTDGSQIGKISAVIRNSSGRGTIEVRLANGPKQFYPVNLGDEYTNGFYGNVQVTKEGTKFTFRIGLERMKNGKIEVYSTKTMTFNDINNEYQRPLSGLAPSVHKHGDAPNSNPYKCVFMGLVVDKLNLQEGGTPYVFQTGDEVVIDHEREVILLNGEPRTDLKYFGGNYFDIPTGDSTIEMQPAGAFDAEMEWRLRYK